MQIRLVIALLCLFLALDSSANALGTPKDVEIRGNSPLKDGINPLFLRLKTTLGGNKYIVDVIDEKSTFFNWKGEKSALHNREAQTVGNYENTHNHYQNLMVSTINKVGNLNAVSVWGDSQSIVDGAKSWGGFFSARSSCVDYATGGFLEEYGDLAADDCDGIDNQLIGVEIDVLNSSKPGVFPNMSKTGLQVVGFGNPNSMAIEIRSVDSDRVIPGKAPGGAFESAFYVKNSIQPEYGRMIVADFDQAKMGLDFRKPNFTEGVMQFRTQGVGTGLIANGGQSGEIYGGDRWSGFPDEKDWLSVRLGEGGFRVVSNDNTDELIAIDNFGGIRLNGDVYINGERFGPNVSWQVNPWLDWRFLTFGLAFSIVNLLILKAAWRGSS